MPQDPVNQALGATKQLSLFGGQLVDSSKAGPRRTRNRGTRRPPYNECRECGRRVGTFREGSLCGGCVNRLRHEREKAESLDARLAAINFNEFPEGY